MIERNIACEYCGRTLAVGQSVTVMESGVVCSDIEDCRKALAGRYYEESYSNTRRISILEEENQFLREQQQGAK